VNPLTNTPYVGDFNNGGAVSVIDGRTNTVTATVLVVPGPLERADTSAGLADLDPAAVPAWACTHVDTASR
jgi:YVTN family beta-propeller protein